MLIELGEELRKVREARGQSLQAVAEPAKILDGLPSEAGTGHGDHTVSARATSPRHGYANPVFASDGACRIPQ